MAAHPFGPIENQLIVGYRKPRFDPKRAKPVFKFKDVLIPSVQVDPLNYLLQPVFYGWSPANGNSSSHDFRVTYGYKGLPWEELLSRGLGYRITFTMPEQEISTRAPTSWPLVNLEVMDIWGREVKHSVVFNETDWSRLDREACLVPWMEQLKQYKTLEIRTSLDRLRLVANHTIEYSFPTYSPPESPIPVLESSLKSVAARFPFLLGLNKQSEQRPRAKNGYLILKMLLLHLKSALRYIQTEPRDRIIGHQKQLKVLLLGFARMLMQTTSELHRVTRQPYLPRRFLSSVITSAQIVDAWWTGSTTCPAYIGLDFVDAMLARVDKLWAEAGNQYSELLYKVLSTAVYDLDVKTLQRQFAIPFLPRYCFFDLENLFRLISDCLPDVKPRELWKHSVQEIRTKSYTLSQQDGVFRSAKRESAGRRAFYYQSLPPRSTQSSLENLSAIPFGDHIVANTVDEEGDETLYLIDLGSCLETKPGWEYLKHPTLPSLSSVNTQKHFDGYWRIEMARGVVLLLQGELASTFEMVYYAFQGPSKLDSTCWTHLQLPPAVVESLPEWSLQLKTAKPHHRARQLFFGLEATRKTIPKGTATRVPQLLMCCAETTKDNSALRLKSFQVLSTADHEAYKEMAFTEDRRGRVYCCYFSVQCHLRVFVYWKNRFMSVGTDKASAVCSGMVCQLMHWWRKDLSVGVMGIRKHTTDDGQACRFRIGLLTIRM